MSNSAHNGTYDDGATSRLTPDDIRRIRELLGLTSVEAGEIIGGGPKAFIKYEKGEIQPAAAVSNLLRLLEADPTALAKLTGRKLEPIENSDVGPFRAMGGHVAVLTDRKLVLLARRLLSAEAQAHDIPTGAIHVAGILNAPDEGEDAHIIWSGGPEKTDFLPSRHCVFQLKATEVSPADAASDIKNSKGEIEPPIRKAIEFGGAYIVLCARELTNKQRILREKRIRESLEAAGIEIKTDQVVFRDAGQIATWANAHPSAATWLLEQTQPGLIGPFRSWTHWAGRYEYESPFVSDKRLDHIRKSVREQIAKRRTVVRVEGASGVGKSRLVLQALSDDDHDMSLMSDLVMYAVEGEAGSAEIKSAVQSLADSSKRAIVVVDRCSPDTHRDLAAIVKRTGSNLSLVTIDSESLGGASVSDETCKVPPADASVIEEILSNKIPGLPSEDQRRLLKFSSGNPAMAMLLSQAWARGEAVSTATEDAMVDSIILGRRPSNSVAVLDAALRLSAFGLVGVSQEREPDVDVISKIGTPRSSDEIRAAFEELERRGVAHRRGRLLTIQPQPIALALAERQWRQWGSGRWDHVLTGDDLPAYLRVHAARRLAQLSTQLVNGREPVAVQVTKHLSRPNGPLDSITKLRLEGRDDVMEALAEIDAASVLTLLERVIEGLDTEELKKIGGGVRRSICHALEKIAFLPSTFERGALLLLKLAVAENETWSNNSTGLFNELFPVLGGNTAASGDVRLCVLDEASKTDDPVKLKIVVKALLSGAQTESTIRSVGAEVHGSRPALKSWLPPLWKDAWKYVDQCLDRLVVIAERHDEVGLYAQSELGMRFRSLVARGQIDFVETTVQRLIAVRPYWPSALNSLADVLQYDEEGLKPGVAEQVRKLISDLTPRERIDRVRYLVSEMPWDYPEDEKITFEQRGARQTAAIENLVRDLLNDAESIPNYFRQLSEGEQRKGFDFGNALAKLSPEPLRWRDDILSAYEATPLEKRNFLFLVGYLSGLSQHDPQTVQSYKEMAWNSSVFAVTLPSVCFSMGITPDDVQLVRKSLAGGFINPHVLGQWTFGGVLAKVTADAVAPLIGDLIMMGSSGFMQAAQLLGMYTFQQREHLERFRPQLRLFAEHVPANGERHVGAVDSHHFKEMMEWILSEGPTDPDARAVAASLAKRLAANSGYDAAKIIQPLLPKLLATFADIAWPIIGNAIVSDQSIRWNFQLALGDPYSFSDEKHPAILSLHEDRLIGWCHANPDVAPAFVASITPIFKTRSTPAAGQEFHPLALRLLDEFGDRQDVLRALTSNSHTFSWSGSPQNYYVLFEKPLSDLATHPKVAVRRWARAELEYMIQRKNAEKDSDDERDAGWEV